MRVLKYHLMRRSRPHTAYCNHKVVGLREVESMEVMLTVSRPERCVQCMRLWELEERRREKREGASKSSPPEADQEPA